MPRKSKSLEDNERREFRAFQDNDYDLILHYNSEILSGIIFPYERNDVTLLEKKLYKDNADDIINAAKSANGGFYTIYYDNDLYLKSLFITFHDFNSGNKSNTGTSVWSEDAFAAIISDMEVHWQGQDIC